MPSIFTTSIHTQFATAFCFGDVQPQVFLSDQDGVLVGHISFQ